jgi:transcriptional regulator with XRE-family HTH domain
MSVPFGELVRRGREHAGLSQSRLANLVGKSATTIRAWEHGRTNPADREAVSAIAAVLGLDENELLGHAGFEAPPARTRLSARQELTSLATERTEMIALATPVETHKHSRSTAPIPEPQTSERFEVEPDSVDAESSVVSEPAPEDEIVIIPVIATVMPAPDLVVTPGGSSSSEQPSPSLVQTLLPPRKARVATPKPPKPRIVVTQPAPNPTQPNPVQPNPAQPNPVQVGSNGFLAGRSYVEDETEKDFYRRRGATTAIVLVLMVIVIWWAFGRTGQAFGDLIESIFGSLDI